MCSCMCVGRGMKAQVSLVIEIIIVPIYCLESIMDRLLSGLSHSQTSRAGPLHVYCVRMRPGKVMKNINIVEHTSTLQRNHI